MAGLQYNFFPTDLLYPLQKTNREINTSQQSILLIKTRKNSDESLDDSKSQNKSINNKKKKTTLKAISSPSFALAPIPKNKKDQD